MAPFYIILITVFSALLRFWKLGILPQMANPSFYHFRLLTGFYSLGSILLLYFIVKVVFNNRKLGLVTSFTFALLPWTVTEGRIISEPVNVLFWLLIIVFFINLTKNKLLKFSLAVFIPFFIYYFYPQLWLFNLKQFTFNINTWMNNLFSIISFEHLFFQSDNFWFGGVRDYGMIYISLLPFFLIGLLQAVSKEEKKLFYLIILLIAITAASPRYPEARELHFLLPVFSIITSLGIISAFNYLKYQKAVIMWILLLIFMYDFSSFLHYYTVHYPILIGGLLSNIHVPF